MHRPSAGPRRSRRTQRLGSLLAALTLALAGCTVDPTSGQTANPNPSDQPFTGPCASR